MGHIHTCIICGEPIGKEGFLGTIKDMSVAFCKEHNKTCKMNCDTCVNASNCPICKGNG